MKLTSSAFANEQQIPEKYSRDSRDVSPPLEWTDVPEGTGAFALFVEDPDAPDDGAWVHWLLYDLPPETRSLPEGVAPNPIVLGSARQGKNDFGDYGYGGPAPPAPAEHRYVFQILALDSPTGLNPGAGSRELQAAVEGHVIDKAMLTGRYKA